ncbi:unnamed protein product [Hermetia illucens]|uniref:Rho-GAP domain-containing protein n=2 Tax=Hermetia illucens TaxID=343691 RepID=A0A7R8YY41_HERIL|nr:unnamed protein product [Hermetia illucens]
MMSSDSDEKYASGLGGGTLTTCTALTSQGEEGSQGAAPSSSYHGLPVSGEESCNRNLLLSKFWCAEDRNSPSTVIYENICEGCRYGIFDSEGRYCNFCRFILSGQIGGDQVENIYENICGQCGRIYNSETVQCEQCSVRPNLHSHFHSEVPKKSSDITVESRSNPKSGAGSAVLRDLLGTFRKVRSRNSKPGRDANKRRKLEIIHNVDAVDYFGRTLNNQSAIGVNQSFEADRSRGRKDNGRRIYGRLRKSDDHLMNSLKAEREASSDNSCRRSSNKPNSKSDSNINNLGFCRGSVSTLDHGEVGRVVECDSATTPAAEATASNAPTATPDLLPSPFRSRPRASSFFMIQDNVVDWLTSLRRQTHDYSPQPASDDSISNIKSIPSLNFNCCGFLCTSTANLADATSAFRAASVYRSRLPSAVELTIEKANVARGEGAQDDDDSLKSLLLTAPSNLRVELMIDNFKRHLMEKRIRSKRRAIYVKVDDSDDIADGSAVVAAAAASAGLASNGERQSKRNAFHERDSQFVNDILIAFDTFLSRESESSAGAGSTAQAVPDDCTQKKATSARDSLSPEAHSDGSDLRVTQQPQVDKTSGNNRSPGQDEQRIGPVVASLVIARKNLLAPTRSQCKREILQSLFNRTDVFIRPSILRNLLTAIEVSKSLKRQLLSLEPSLRTFLHAVSSSPIYVKFDQKTLIEMYASAAIVITPTSPTNKKPRPIGHKSAITSGDKSGDTSDNGSDKSSAPAPSAPEDDIYQPIWKFRTIGNPRESYLSIEPTDDLTGACSCATSVPGPNDSSSLSVEDLSDWETDDEFIFASEHSSPLNRFLPRASPRPVKKYLKNNKSPSDRASPASSPRLGERIRALKTSLLKPHSSSQSLASFSSNFSADSAISTSTNNSCVSYNPKSGYAVKRKYQRVCILYNHEDPRLRAIIYKYDDARRGNLTSQLNHRNSSSNDYQKKRESTPASVRAPEVFKAPDKEGCKRTKVKSTRPPTNDFMPLCVQAWKFTLLDVNNLDDEEDMYISRDEILSTFRDSESPPTTLKKCASEGNLLQIPPDKKKTFGERFINKFQAVGFFPISPRQMKDKKKLDYFKRRGSIGLYFPNTPNKAPVFGGTLEQVQLSGISNVPEFVVDCINIIERPEFICTDGLYRASGNKVEMDIVKKSLTERYDAKILENQDIHTITGLLKLFFRELKTALISDDVYNKLPDNLADKENLSSIKNVLYLMPCVSRDTLKYLIKHLTKVASESHTNRMPASNLAIIWGPCILYSSFTNPMSIARINTLTKVLIEHYDTLFNEEDERLIM